jgi:hypothetical protein
VVILNSIGNRKLYHGSPILFDEINLKAGGVYKDFGQGFYLTADKKHAISAGKHNRLYNGGEIYLYEYRFPAGIENQLSIKQFEYPNGEWLRFIKCNREGVRLNNEFDVVVGPIADARVFNKLQDFRDGKYTRLYGNMAEKKLIEDLKPYRYPYQICIITERARTMLKRESISRLEV